ncbi:MAG: hypothetical protein N3B18_07860, partial [Desulfobacterota bacterium]|nr:hypothetical protein [Thermodesulfobacteriota bacterium]
MRLFRRKSKRIPETNRQRNVVPGIIATVTDDKENTVYLDLELEPEENAHAFSSYPAEDIPPGL